ncbi:hypothetical protein SCHPADRAFT_892897 [Schizopora paradoxa]|uniref:Uncharacterized protein n=1 Tax=Schizopora paradoxa TaxID=27342 RepID=A0A0H2RJT8_9AGAM|nr:hypothetical protein SCHPADRAFT_892897 [Schizopora paradoxa]
MQCMVTSPGAECFHCKKMGRICIISKRDHVRPCDTSTNILSIDTSDEEQLVGIYNAKWYEPEKVKVKRPSRSKKPQHALNGDQRGGSISPMQSDLPTNMFEDLSVSTEPVLRLYYNVQESTILTSLGGKTSAIEGIPSVSKQ